jgi:hypothetical protein
MNSMIYKLMFVILMVVLPGFGFNTPTEYKSQISSAVPYNLDFRSGVPDAMNKINIFDNITGSFKTLNADSLPIFPGYPQQISGSTFEGGIFCNMDNDPILEIVYNIGYTVQAFNPDGTTVPGWPKTVPSYALDGAPAFGDIDGDGFGEIVVTNHGLTSGGFIYAFKRDGTPVTGFPINHGYSSRTPVLSDINNDNKCEIIVNKRIYPVGEVWIYKGDGTSLTGWPKAITHVPASSSAVGDIDGDGLKEIISESYTGLFAWKANGDSIPGFPFMMPNTDVNSYSSPVLSDVDGDGFREIIFGTHVSGGGGYVYILKKNGTVLTGWPKATGNWVYGPPAVGYIDNDNILDIAVGDQVMSGTPVDYLYAWNKNGTALTGFPVGPLNAINAQIVLADIDNDNNTELICDDNTQTAGKGKFLAFNHDGTPCVNWPIETIGTTMFVTPCVADINRDNHLDIIGAGITGSGSGAATNVYIWNAGVPYNPLKIQIPIWQYNARHTGVYGEVEIVGVNNPIVNIPAGIELSQNYPNPFNPGTKISYSLDKSSYINLSVYDISGKLITVLDAGYRQPGKYEKNFEEKGLTSGIYFYRLLTESESFTKTMLYIK